MSNVTVDDTAPTLSYGPGWGVASSNDAALGQYFQSTYHASETTGAVVNLTFSGSATGIYLYGSKGPDHGNFSVRYDSNIAPGLSAHADKPEYQQLLFKAIFPSSTQPHTLTLNNTSAEQGRKWVDLDFLTITTGNTTVTQVFSSTISPLPVPSSTIVCTHLHLYNPDPSASSRGSSAQSSSGTYHSPPSRIALIFSIIFGVFLFLIASGISAYFIRRHLRATRNKSHRVSSASSHPPLAPGSAFQDGQSSLRFPAYDLRNSAATHPSHSSLAASSVNAKRNSAVPPFNTLEVQPEMREEPSSPGNTQSSFSQARTWSRSPLTSPIKALFASNVKEGTDSMKSTFLKV